MNTISKLMLRAGLAAMSLATAGTAHAALTLNAAGINLGFSLTTFATVGGNGLGPIGSATLSNGNIAVYDSNSNRTYVFNDVDGQTLGTALNSAPVTSPILNTLTRYNNIVYGTYFEGNSYYISIVNANGTRGANVANLGSVGYTAGLSASPVRNSLLVATGSGIFEIDLSNPNVNANKRMVTSAGADGIVVSVDGLSVYGSVGGGLQAFNIATGAQTYNAGPLNFGTDGIGIILSGTLAGNLITNNTNGTLALINPLTNVNTIIATGGSYGDLTGFDANNGTMFINQSNALLRLSLGGSGIGGGGTTTAPTNGTVPEPATWALMLVGFGLTGAAMRRKQAQPRVSLSYS